MQRNTNLDVLCQSDGGLFIHDRRSALQRRVTSRLVQAASAALPRTKSSQLARAWKSRSVDLARKAKKDSSQRVDDANDGQAIVLPRELMTAVLAHLQPVSLAIMACISREWNAAVADDMLWRRFLPVHIRHDAVRGTSSRSSLFAGIAGVLRVEREIMVVRQI